MAWGWTEATEAQHPEIAKGLSAHPTLPPQHTQASPAASLLAGRPVPSCRGGSSPLCPSLCSSARDTSMALYSLWRPLLSHSLTDLTVVL